MDKLEKTPFPFPPRRGALERFPEFAPWDVPIFQMSDWWLAIECCGLSHFPLRLMAARFGWRLTLRQVVPRLRCKKCKGWPRGVVLMDGPEGEGGRFGAKSRLLRLI